MGKTSNSVPDCSLFLEGKMARHVITDQCLACGQWFGWMVRNLEKNMTGKLVTRRFLERGMWIDLSEWTKNVKTLVSHVNAHLNDIKRGYF